MGTPRLHIVTALDVLEQYYLDEGDVEDEVPNGESVDCEKFKRWCDVLYETNSLYFLGVIDHGRELVEAYNRVQKEFGICSGDFAYPLEDQYLGYAMLPLIFLQPYLRPPLYNHFVKFMQKSGSADGDKGYHQNEYDSYRLFDKVRRIYDR